MKNKKNLKTDKARDTGMAIVLLLLIAFYFTLKPALILAAIICQILNMVVPRLFSPMAAIWFGISRIMGDIVSIVLMTLLFIFLVTPVALIRKIGGADTMQRRRWKANNNSVFTIREHTFSSDDLIKPF